MDFRQPTKPTKCPRARVGLAEELLGPLVVQYTSAFIFFPDFSPEFPRLITLPFLNSD